MDSVSPEVQACREGQADALEHMQHEPGSCGHPQCSKRNVEQYLLDSFAEELMWLYPEVWE
jgi:hypothetical protein